MCRAPGNHGVRSGVETEEIKAAGVPTGMMRMAAAGDDGHRGLRRQRGAHPGRQAVRVHSNQRPKAGSSRAPCKSCAAAGSPELVQDSVASAQPRTLRAFRGHCQPPPASQVGWSLGGVAPRACCAGAGIDHIAHTPRLGGEEFRVWVCGCGSTAMRLRDVASTSERTWPLDGSSERQRPS